MFGWILLVIGNDHNIIVCVDAGGESGLCYGRWNVIWVYLGLSARENVVTVFTEKKVNDTNVSEKNIFVFDFKEGP